MHAQSHRIDGSRKIAVSLRDRPELEAACRNTVAQGMRTLGLKSRLVRRFTPTTTQADPTRVPAPNVLAQDFTATASNRKWVTDITYLATTQGWVYFAVVLDLFSRKVVGWAMGPSLATELACAARSRHAAPPEKTCCTTVIEVAKTPASITNARYTRSAFNAR